MNQTNDEKIDLSKSLPETPAPTTLGIEELKGLTEVDNQRGKMARLIHFRIFTLFLIALLALGVYSQSIAKRTVVSVPTQESTETENFRELLNSLDPSTLHEILHEHLKEKYQHGVYQEDKKAMEVVHQQNAEVAITLIELAKRQAPGNGTTVTLPAGPPTTISTTVSITSTPPTSSVVVISTSSVAVPTSAPPSSSAVQPSQPSQTQAPPTSVQQPTSATRPSLTEVPSQPGSSTQAMGTSSERHSQSSITNVGTTSTSTSQATSSALTPSSRQTTSDSREPTSTSAPSPTTTTEPQSSITQQVVFETTLANGSQSFVTSVTVVPAQQPAQTGAASKTESGSASLQTNAAQKNGYEMRAALLGAVGMAVAAVI
ncbi:hypothetical protein HYALB_00003199 [Hymenoscyphus albidus]|uniref:Uncharacterized protein n=1 Tax=Hymenoscyphus albidus TaxID=595503 RepID=A0A9N9LYK2_9HELO|nr:hypothetical protein HYALB_00003199 [Hymenoscyphus albidus]